MPRIGGVELARKVAQDCPSIPLILMTGHTLDERDAIEQHSAAFLGKPLSLRALTDGIEICNAKARVASERRQTVSQASVISLNLVIALSDSNLSPASALSAA